MINEEIMTGLRNAIEHGDSLQNAMQIMMNSGYNPTEVQEASKFFAGGILNKNQPKPEEQLTMPEKKPGFFSKLKKGTKKIVQQSKQPINQTQILQQTPQTKIPLPAQNTENIQQSMQSLQSQQSKKPLAQQLQKIKPPKKSYKKEIILLIALLFLIGILITTIFLKNTILGWFS